VRDWQMMRRRKCNTSKRTAMLRARRNDLCGEKRVGPLARHVDVAGIGEKPIAMHVVLGPLKPCEWRKFHYVHGHHHLVHMRKRLENKVVR